MAARGWGAGGLGDGAPCSPSVGCGLAFWLALGCRARKVMRGTQATPPPPGQAVAAAGEVQGPGEQTEMDDNLVAEDRV